MSAEYLLVLIRNVLAKMRLSHVLAVFLVFVFSTSLGSETITLRTWYPSPYGSYKRMKITESLTVGTPTVPLSVNGDILQSGTFASDLLTTKKICLNGECVETFAPVVREGCTASGNRCYFQLGKLLVQTGHTEVTDTCEGPSYGGVCNGNYTVQVVFPVAFKSKPLITVAPEQVGRSTSCGFATDAVGADYRDVTRVGFKFHINGSPLNANACGAAYDGWQLPASGQWMAIGEAVQ